MRKRKHDFSSKEVKAMVAELRKRFEMTNDIVDNPVIAVVIKVDYGGSLYWETGSSRCKWTDWFNMARGYQIAQGRALKKLAVRLLEAGLGLPVAGKIHSEAAEPIGQASFTLPPVKPTAIKPENIYAGKE